MKLFNFYVMKIRAARDVWELQLIVSDVLKHSLIVDANPWNPDEFAAEVRRNIGYLQQLLELADAKLKEFEVNNA